MASTTSYVTPTVSYEDTNLTNATNSSDIVTFDPRKAAEYARLWQLENSINAIYLWPIVIVGLPSNLVTVATVWLMASGTSSYYLGSLAACDALAIVVKVAYRETSKYVAMGHVGCKLFNYAGVTTTTLANWVLVALAVERYYAVANPLWVSNQRGLRKTLAVLAGLLAAVALIYLHLLLTYGAVPGDAELPCGLLPGFQLLKTVWPWVDMLLYGLLPCLLLLLLNVLLLYKLRSSMVAQRRLVTGSQQMTSQRLQRQISAMLLTASFVFLALVLPICVFLVLDPFLQPPPHLSFADAAIFNRKKALAKQVCFVLCDSSHAINFFLYILSGARFRQHFLELVRCRLLRRDSANDSSQVLEERSYSKLHRQITLRTYV